ncbi:hypothetical protein [Olleya sp. YS]|uniref:hypothetical protein n=1 Tax=Olleya sp. YS TaxID=3028318 RepID=UPI0024343319|nr:hypothetical protein [Olleya sp. YS]WGD35026.1 hypothetical protein Ollyesu_01090 [Olleya sp. YS]
MTNKKRDVAFMIISGAIIVVGIIGLFVFRPFGLITIVVGAGMLLMAYLSKL